MELHNYIVAKGVRGGGLEEMAVEDGPVEGVVIAPELGFAFWLQPDGFTSFGMHGEPGELICAPLDNGELYLEGRCSSWDEVISDGGPAVVFENSNFEDRQVGEILGLLVGDLRL